MAIAYKAYKYRIYPTDEQAQLFQKTFGCCRFIWNMMLSDKIDYYNKEKKMLKCTPAQYKKKYDFLREVDSLALANVQLNQQSAFQKFFKEKKVGFPHFHSKKNTRKSYTTNKVGNNIDINDRYIKLPKVGIVRIKKHREPYGVLKSVTVSQTSTGKYFVSVLFEYENQVQEKNDTAKSVGLDFSMRELYVDSSGNEPSYPHFYRKKERRLAREQRKLSKMYRKGQEQSNRYYRQKMKVNKIHEKIANQRKDFLHKLSRHLVDTYDYICIEDVDMKAMSQCLNFGKSVHDNGWGMFTSMLAYKCEEEGKHLQKIDKWYPSSQTCHVCGTVHDITKDLSVREWTCPDCHTHHNRDVNAAINILNAGMQMIA